MDPDRRQRQNRKVPIAVVAKAAQTSISTVSRVLNGGSVSAVLRARVNDAISELRYAPSLAARNLQAGRTGRIGVVCATNQTSWFLQVLAGVETRLASTGQSVLLASLVLNGRYDSHAVNQWIRLRGVDGLIFVRATPRESCLLSAAQSANVPVVLIAPDVAAPARGSVRCDNVTAGRLVAEHLLECGHRRVAFIGGPRESLDTRERLFGLVEILRRERSEPLDEDVSYANDYAHASGVRGAVEFLKRSVERRPTAMVFGNDAMAIGFMRTVLQSGVRVPEDVSVVGFDGIPIGELYWPGLTTVVQPSHQMGVTACTTLLDYIEGANLDPSTNIQHGVQLILRESTGVPGLRT
jgi:LacI family transcriptional regulator